MISRLTQVIAVVCVALLAWIWLASDDSGQEKMMLAVPVLACLGAVTVLILFRVKGRRKTLAHAIGALLVFAGIAFPIVFRLRGLTGDFFPVLEYRFAPKPDATLPPLPGALEQTDAAPGPAATADAAPHDTSPPPGLPRVGRPLGDPAKPATRDVATPEPARPGVSKTSTTDVGASESFPQFLGPSRTGVIPGIRISRDWATNAPRLLWRIPVGAGWSGFAIDRGLAITQEQRGGDEAVVAYELTTGRPRWSHRDTVRYDSVIAGDGPRATPTIAGGYVATLGSTGVLNVVEFDTGRRLWTRQIGVDASAPSPEWGRSGSPLVHDGRVIVSAGGPDGQSLIAYDLRTGARVWAGGDAGAGYSSPVLLTLLGRPQVVIFNRDSLVGHDPATGAVLWTQAWQREAPNVAQPLRISDDLVLAATGYGVGSKLVRLSDRSGVITTSLVWESLRLKPKFANPVLYEGFVYGLDDGVLVCLDPSTGERRWKAGRYGHGQTLIVGDVLLIATEDGEVVLVEPTPEAHRELARFAVFNGKTWNPPAIAGKYLLVRTDKEAALYELTLAK